jgi:hypothetical protein
MKRTIAYTVLALLLLTSFKNVNQSAAKSNGYSEVNGIKMYYEIYGQGKASHSF